MSSSDVSPNKSFCHMDLQNKDFSIRSVMSGVYCRECIVGNVMSRVLTIVYLHECIIKSVLSRVLSVVYHQECIVKSIVSSVSS